ncbi:MAG: class I SAM-dependent methyltransferase [bacterium]|nr:class I SAM-dependent methyltransferase [bacterium]
MNHFQSIYDNEADTYHRLIAAEDTYGELAAKIEEIAARSNTIVDIGTGTGRLALQLSQPGKRIHGIDIAQAMLDVAAAKLEDTEGQWVLSQGDARDLPVADDWADAAVAGWIFGHFTEFGRETWERDLDTAIAEMRRVVKSGGIEVVVDTLGTAVTEPAAPAPLLDEYHRRLETLGFERSVLRTDYRFASVEESIELLDWFFGLGDWARDHNSPVVPEFTGWWQRSVD